MGWFSGKNDDRAVQQQIDADLAAAERAEKMGMDSRSWQRKADEGRRELARRDRKRLEAEDKRKRDTRRKAAATTLGLQREYEEPGFLRRSFEESVDRRVDAAYKAGNTGTDIEWEIRKAQRRW